MLQAADRMSNLSKSVLTQIAEVCRQKRDEGMDIIDLSIGSPDLPPADHIISALKLAIEDGYNYGYPSSRGTDQLRQAISNWYQANHGVDIDPGTEVCSLMGSQDGL